MKCLICNRVVVLKSGYNAYEGIDIDGQVEVLFDAEIYVECACGNEITIEK